MGDCFRCQKPVSGLQVMIRDQSGPRYFHLCCLASGYELVCRVLEAVDAETVSAGGDR